MNPEFGEEIAKFENELTLENVFASMTVDQKDQVIGLLETNLAFPYFSESLQEEYPELQEIQS